MQAPIINEDIWTRPVPEITYYTIRIYNPSGFGVTKEWVNVPATSIEDAKRQGAGSYRLAQGEMYRVVAFKQEARVL
jgi:hypothetical protein